MGIMNPEHLNLDDFDADPVEEVQPEIVPATREQIELEQTEKIGRYRRVRDLILSPEVAQCLRDGWTQTEIAEVLGVDKNTISRYVRSAEMQVLIDRESRRLLRSLARQKLDNVNYRDRVLSLGVLVDKARLLRDEPTEIIKHEEGTASRLAEIFFRRRARPTGEDAGGEVIDITPEPAGRAVLGVPEQPDQAVSQSDRADSSGSDEPPE